MLRTIVRTSVVLGVVIFGACGGGSSDTTQPVVTVASITLTASAAGAFTSFADTRVISAVAKDASGATVSSPTITWSTSNASVATVSGSGSSATVTSVGNGTATISAKSGTATSTLDVTVAQAVASVATAAGSTSLVIGATTSITATPRDARGSAVTGLSGITFATSDRKVAFVDATTGAVTAISPGSATITATLVQGGTTTTGTTALAVSLPASGATTAAVTATGSLTFTPSSVTVGAGGVVSWTFQATHTVTFQGGVAQTDIPATSSGIVARTFAAPGTYNYICTIHGASVMSGTVIVSPPNVIALLNGANERPTANTSPANGAAVFTRNGGTVTYTVTFQNIASAPTGLHIHAPGNSSQAASVIVDLLKTPQTNTSGVLTGTFTAADIKPLGGAPAITLDSLYVLLNNGNAYVNIHSTTFPGGEVRGQTSP